jgi:tetratricopeptide (TPR) repeat protein
LIDSDCLSIAFQLPFNCLSRDSQLYMKHFHQMLTGAHCLALCLTVINTFTPCPVFAQELTAEQYFKRGSQEIIDGQNAAATEDFDRALQKDAQYWKAYGARSASRYNCGDYQGALKDIDIAIAHLPPKQSLTYHKELVEKAIANKNAQLQNQATRQMAQQMLLNAELGMDYGSPAYLIMMAARKRAGLNPLTGLPLGTPIAPVANAPRSGNADPANPSSVSSRLEAMNPGAFLPPLRSASPQAIPQPTTTFSHVQPAEPVSTQPIEQMNSQSIASVQPLVTSGVQSVTAPDINKDGMTAQQYFDRACGKGHAMDFAGALKDYDEAIRLDPRHGPAYANRGSLRFNSGDQKGALEDFNKAVMLMPDNKGLKDLRDVVIKATHQ